MEAAIASSPSADGEIPHGAFLFAKLFLLRLYGQKKKRTKELAQSNKSLPAPPRQKFSPAFFKRRRSGGRAALLALRRARNTPKTALFFLPSFFFCAYVVKRKSGITNPNNPSNGGCAEKAATNHTADNTHVGATIGRPRITQNNILFADRRGHSPALKTKFDYVPRRCWIHKKADDRWSPLQEICSLTAHRVSGSKKRERIAILSLLNHTFRIKVSSSSKPPCG